QAVPSTLNTLGISSGSQFKETLLVTTISGSIAMGQKGFHLLCEGYSDDENYELVLVKKYTYKMMSDVFIPNIRCAGRITGGSEVLRHNWVVPSPCFLTLRRAGDSGPSLVAGIQFLPIILCVQPNQFALINTLGAGSKRLSKCAAVSASGKEKNCPGVFQSAQVATLALSGRARPGELRLSDEEPTLGNAGFLAYFAFFTYFQFALMTSGKCIRCLLVRYKLSRVSRQVDDSFPSNGTEEV
ncbi:unnamed protein product, partial [Nesidiocoris tenuis]